MTLIDDLTGQLRGVLQQSFDLGEKVEKDRREYSADERQQIKGLADHADVLRRQLTDAKAHDSLRNTMKEFGLAIGEPPATNGNKSVDGFATIGKGRSLGQEVTESAQYKSLMARFPTGSIPEKARLESEPMGFKSLITGGDNTSGGALVVPDYTGILEMLGRPPLVLRNLISERTTQSDTVEFVRQTNITNNAAWVPEATATSGTSGTKPEGGFTLEQVRESVKNLAEWIPATKRAIADVGQLRGMIDQELTNDLAQTEEDGFLNGDGTGENPLGILNTPGIQSQPYTNDVFTTTRQAQTKCRIVGRVVPTAYLFNPQDDEAIDLQQDQMGRFYGNGPFGVGPATLWGLPRVVSEFLPAGKAIVAAWPKAVVWDREQATISITDSHLDFFVRNMVAILAEQREAFGVIRPTAFVVIDLTSGP